MAIYDESLYGGMIQLGQSKQINSLSFWGFCDDRPTVSMSAKHYQGGEVFHSLSLDEARQAYDMLGRAIRAAEGSDDPEHDKDIV